MICIGSSACFWVKKEGASSPVEGSWHNYEKVLSKVIRLYLAFDLL